MATFAVVTPTPSPNPSPDPAPGVKRFIYAAQSDGRIAVYDIDNAHQLVKTLTAFTCCADVRGATAAAPTHRFYVMYNRNKVPFVGTTGTTGHGIAWSPDESEVWADDGGNPYVHVFDMTTTPPTQTHLVRVSRASPHWIIFSIDGSFAYVAGPKGSGSPTDIIDTGTYQPIGTLGSSEDLLEVDIAGANVLEVGNQFGVGRLTRRSPA